MDKSAQSEQHTKLNTMSMSSICLAMICGDRWSEHHQKGLAAIDEASRDEACLCSSSLSMKLTCLELGGCMGQV